MGKIFISTAEPSAELHASHLARALLERAPGMEIDAAGGEVLASAGANIRVDMTGRAVMGIWEAIAQIFFYRKAALRIEESLLSGGYDALVLVDAASFHLPLAKRIHARLPDLPIVCYIAPKLWAWKKWRIKNLRRDFAKTLCIFPFEEKYFGDQGVRAVYVGNPTFDQVKAIDQKAMAVRFGVDPETMHTRPERGLLAVFPGSRGSEIKYLWPEVSKTVALLHSRFPELKIAVSLAPGMTREKLRKYAPLPDAAEYVEGESQQLLAASSAVLAKSGTTTLEAALLGKPMAVCFRTHAINEFMVRLFVTLPYFSLPNIIAGKTIVREMLQKEASAAAMAEEMGRILSDPNYYHSLRDNLLALRNTFGTEAVTARAADEILQYRT